MFIIAGVMGYEEVHCKSLDHDLEVVQQKFIILLHTTNQSLTSRIKPVQLARCVLDLAHTKPGTANTMNALLIDQRDALLYAESVPQIFTTLAPYWSPVNSELLQHIISELGCAKDKLKMDAYKTLVCAWESADIPSHALGTIDKDSRVNCKPEAHLNITKSDSWCHGKWPSVALNNGGVVVEVHNKFPSSWSYLRNVCLHVIVYEARCRQG